MEREAGYLCNALQSSGLIQLYHDQHVYFIHQLYHSHQLLPCNEYFCERGIYSCGIIFNQDGPYVI